MIHGVCDVVTLETIACKEALSLVEDLFLHGIVIATDSKQVARDTQKESCGVHGQIIVEINLRALNFNCNFFLRVGHRIAKPIHLLNFLTR